MPPKKQEPTPPKTRKAPTSSETALHQKRTREQHAQERAQDYVEAIAKLIDANGEARATELARVLGVSHVTVIRTVARLQQKGLVTTQPYRSIFLTEQGWNLAAVSCVRHDAVVEFLIAIGVPPATARADAEGIEHHISPETLAAFRKYIASQDEVPPPHLFE